MLTRSGPALGKAGNDPLPPPSLGSGQAATHPSGLASREREKCQMLADENTMSRTTKNQSKRDLLCSAGILDASEDRRDQFGFERGWLAGGVGSLLFALILTDTRPLLYANHSPGGGRLSFFFSLQWRIFSKLCKPPEVLKMGVKTEVTWE